MATKTKKSTSAFEEEEALPVGSEEYISFKASHFYSVLVVLAFAVGVLVGYVAWGSKAAIAAAQQQAAMAAPAATAQAPNQVAEAPTAAQYVRYKVPTDGFPSLGPADAKITIVEFSDFQCPFCRRFHQETYQALLAAYPDQIRFVYRDLPLTSIHPNAMGAAVAAQCANDQNAFWPYHDKLFASENLGDDIYKQYASELNLDMDKFDSCLTSGSHDTAIQADMDYSLSIGVQSTPTFFVNGLAIVGAQPLTSFQQLIDKELAGEIPQ